MNIANFFHPPSLDIMAHIIATASVIAAVTPNKYDDQVLQIARKLVDFLAFNVGNAVNAKRR